MRIRQPAAKIGYPLVVVVAITLTTIPLSAVSVELGFAWAVVTLLAAVLVAARTFRGAAESDAPRPWWKMTSTRGGGALLGALFFIQGVTASLGSFASPNPPLAVIGGVLALIVSALYLNSAIRIRPVPASTSRED